MATNRRAASGARLSQPAQSPLGSVRACMPYRGEIARHRVLTADGHDFVVATLSEGQRYITAAYPVQHGYLVMVRQALCAWRNTEREAAEKQHDQLVRVLAEAGVGIVRARRSLAARRRVEQSAPLEYDAWSLSGVLPAVTPEAALR